MTDERPHPEHKPLGDAPGEDVDADARAASTDPGASASGDPVSNPQSGVAESAPQIDAIVGASASDGDAGAAGDAPPDSEARADARSDGAGGAPANATAGDGGKPSADTLDSVGRGFEAFAAEMQDSIDKAKGGDRAASAPRDGSSGTRPVELNDFSGPASAAGGAHRVSMLHDVKLGVKIELGRTKMLVEEVLKMNQGTVVELDKLAGDPVDVYANERLVARGEILILNDNFCVRINEVVTQDPHRVAQ